MMQDDDLLERLAGLRPIAPDVEWERRVRTRCHSAMGRCARPPRHRTLFGAKVLDLAAAAALCVYLAAVLMEAARLGGSF